ncbi:uncharacterized protein LOC118509294 [Anopheles stephensi]|uniref:uncharacterized protein LOC118509294 n=1 Tax=Anopheles stephensi TaxID=30069 RepID=UPI0016588807|nr:uncharacterized protein LOC118509294 [Anopheles stephensi]
MLATYITLLSAGCLLLVNAGKMIYYNDRLPVETVPSASYYWPNQNILPGDEPDAMHYPTWFQLPWRPFPILPQQDVEEQPEIVTVPPPEVDTPPSTTTETPDETPEGRHLHHEKPHKHHHKHKHHKHKHHHHHHDKGTKTDESGDLQGANVGQLKMVILQLEHKLEELKLQLFGSRSLTNDAAVDNEHDDEDAARFDVDASSDPEVSDEREHLVDELSPPSPKNVLPTSEEKDEGKLLVGGSDKTTSELVLEHREVESSPFDNGRSLAENVQKWFEGLDLGKIAALPLEESVESEDVSGTIDVRGQF